jgi:type IV pilus assembly protein PilF
MMETATRVWMAAMLIFMLAACKHTPTAEDQKRADGNYVVALAFVHEAQRVGVAGKLDEQDLKYRQAMKELLTGARLDPENSEIQYLLGLVYFVGFRRHAEAETHLKVAIGLRDDKFPEADHLLGTVLVDAGKPNEALPFLERARTSILYPTPYFAEQEMGWAKYRLERYDEAARHFENALRAQPDLCGSYTRLADVYEAKQDYVSARRVLHEFLERCDSDRLRENTGSKLLVYGYFRMGMTLLKVGEAGKAKTAFSTCVSRFSSEPIAAKCNESLRLLQ